MKSITFIWKLNHLMVEPSDDLMIEAYCRKRSDDLAENLMISQGSDGLSDGWKKPGNLMIVPSDNRSIWPMKLWWLKHLTIEASDYWSIWLLKHLMDEASDYCYHDYWSLTPDTSYWHRCNGLGHQQRDSYSDKQYNLILSLVPCDSKVMKSVNDFDPHGTRDC